MWDRTGGRKQWHSGRTSKEGGGFWAPSVRAPHLRWTVTVAWEPPREGRRRRPSVVVFARRSEQRSSTLGQAWLAEPRAPDILTHALVPVLVGPLTMPSSPTLRPVPALATVTRSPTRRPFAPPFGGMPKGVPCSGCKFLMSTSASSLGGLGGSLVLVLELVLPGGTNETHTRSRHGLYSTSSSDTMTTGCPKDRTSLQPQSMVWPTYVHFCPIQYPDNPATVVRSSSGTSAAARSTTRRRFES